MKLDQLALNELETAILDELALEDPLHKMEMKNLHVLSREYTGVGSFTKFQQYSNLNLVGGDRQIGLAAKILVPGLKNGLGAWLFFENKNPSQLEIFTYGEELWNGVFNGFEIKRNV